MNVLLNFENMPFLSRRHVLCFDMSDLEEKSLNFRSDSFPPSEIFPLTFSIQYDSQSFINNTKYLQKHSVWRLLSDTLRKQNINLNCWYVWGLP
jgi:hypothetical protein